MHVGLLGTIWILYLRLWPICRIGVLGWQNDDCYSLNNRVDSISRMEFQYVSIVCDISARRKCHRGPLTMSWTKDDVELEQHVKKKSTKAIYMAYRLDNLRLSDAGEYRCRVSNEATHYSHTISLTVTAGDRELELIRNHTVPQSSDQIRPDRLYWNPRMTDINLSPRVTLLGSLTVHCQFYSLHKFNESRAHWYARRSRSDDELRCGNETGELVVHNSPYNLSLYEYDCLDDPLVALPRGHCYSMELVIRPVTLRTHRSFTCVIGDGALRLSRVLVVEFTDLSEMEYHFYKLTHSDVASRNPHVLEDRLLFMDNSSVCEGHPFTMVCRSPLSNGAVSLVHRSLNGAACDTTLIDSVANLSFHINRTTEANSGVYICRLRNYAEKSMFLTVQSCMERPWRMIYIVSSLLTSFVLSTIIVLICVIMRRVRQAMQLRNSERIYIMKRLILNEVVKNPDYLSIQIDSQLEIARDRIHISGDKLGEGNFGMVFRGLLDSRDVAIKMASERGEDMLVDEVQMMHQLGCHRHILELLGVSHSEGRLLVVMELASGGSLKMHLQENNPLFNASCKGLGLEQLLLYAVQISQGMEYLSSKSVVHRDLAARNILLSANGDIKIADFGLTRIVINYYQSSGSSEDCRPVRWMAPECFTENRFTTKSDVWSFGIVLWEIYSLGMLPYFSVAFNEVRTAICNGVINDKPDLAPDWVFDLMKRCWRYDEDLRPIFSDIVTQLDSTNDNEYI